MRDKNGRFTRNADKIEGLPERWCINRKDHPEIGRWFNQHNESGVRDYDVKAYGGYMTHHPGYGIRNHAAENVQPGYTEITWEQFKKHVLKMKDEFVLPEKWCIQSGDSEVVRFFNTHGKEGIQYDRSDCENHYCHYPLSSGYVLFDHVCDGYTEITLEQFKKYVLKEAEFVLPAKWCIKSGDPNVVKYCNDHGENPPYSESECSVCYAHFPGFGKATTATVIQPGYTEITLEQFKKYVLNQKEETMKPGRKLIGYKVIKEFPNTLDSLKLGYVMKAVKFGDGGWGRWPDIAAEHPEFFEPVYEDEKPNVEIRGYKAVFDEYGVTFGCQKYTEAEILKFIEILGRSGLILSTFHKEVLTIGEYLKNRK